jgi:hypothetical protein
MRRILIALLILIVLVVTMSILWIFGGRQLSLFVDRFKTVEIASVPIKSLVYEGSGTGGTFLINDLHLSLSSLDAKSAEPNIGTTKDGQLALSFGGKVFPFALPRSETESLATTPPAGDDASISTRHSILSWVIPPDFKTGRPFTWRRQLYYRLVWKKQNGAKLEMLWRYEQPFSPENNAWPPNESVYPGEGSTGLIRVDISSPLPSPQSSP